MKTQRMIARRRGSRDWLVPAILCLLAALLALPLAAPLVALADEDENGDASEAGSLRRSDRMEFDARLVRGQKATSGAVYLFQRAPRALPPLVVLEQSYLDRIVDPVLGPQGDRQAVE